jgi:thiol-disulfide isomerase/thioredoxin
MPLRRSFLALVMGCLLGVAGAPLGWTTLVPSAQAQPRPEGARDRPAGTQASEPLDQPVPPELLERLQKVSRAGLAQTPHFQPGPLKAIEDENVPPGRPLVLYIGADYCPYCAVLRWPLAVALMRFGDLEGLRYMRSSARDVFPSTPTFSFVDAKLENGRLELQAVELEDRDGKALEKPDATQRDKFVKLNPRGSIPFLYLGGKYLEVGSPFSPEPLQGLDWTQVVELLEQTGNAVWQDVIGEANVLTAALCTLTNEQPNDVCLAPAIAAAAQHLPR